MRSRLQRPKASDGLDVPMPRLSALSAEQWSQRHSQRAMKTGAREAAGTNEIPRQGHALCKPIVAVAELEEQLHDVTALLKAMFDAQRMGQLCIEEQLCAFGSLARGEGAGSMQVKMSQADAQQPLGFHALASLHPGQAGIDSARRSDRRPTAKPALAKL